MSIASFIHSSGVRNFAKLLSANVVAQVIGLIVYPILTRIYTPEDFGLLNLFLSIANVLVILAIADYYYAIVLPKDEKHAVSLTQISFLCLLVTVGLVAISSVFANPISKLFNTPALAQYYWMLPIYILAMGTWNILNYWYIRQKMFGHISGFQITQSVLSSGGKIGLGYAGLLNGGMIYSAVIAPIVSLFLSFSFNLRRTIVPLRNVSWKDILEQGKRYRNFPLFVLPRSFINVLAGQMPVLLLTPFFGAKYVGLLSMAILLGYTPICTISRAVYQVLYQYITDCVHQSLCIGKIFRRFISCGSLVIIPAFALLYVVLPDLTGWLLGSEWYVVGKYIRWMLPWLYVSLLTGSICFLSDVFQKQKIGLVFEILLVFGRLLGLCIGVFFNDFMVAIAAYSIGTAVAIIPQLIWLISLVVKYDRSLVVGSDN